MSKTPLVVGWREWVSLPQLGVSAIKAKVDTGARTSALHAYVENVFVDSGTQMIAFIVHPHQSGAQTEIRAVAPLADERNVRSSNGMIERRYFIATDLLMGGQRWAIEISLTSRKSMGYPVLLGRQALRRRILVNPARSYVLGKPDIAGV